MQIVVNDLLTHYNLEGKGKLVVLLHGWGDNLTGLSQISKLLSKKFQVLSLDLPGFGGTQVPKEVWGLDEYAIFIKTLLKKLELKQPYALLGHSNGGAVSIRAVATGVLKPQKLVLLASSGIRNGGGTKRSLLKIIAKTGDVATIGLPERYRKSLRKSLYATVGSDLLIVPALEETFKKTVRQDVQDDAAKITTPSLLIFAEDDVAVPLADGQRFHDLIAESELHIVKKSGHFIQLDQPEQVQSLLERFLE